MELASLTPMVYSKADNLAKGVKNYRQIGQKRALVGILSGKLCGNLVDFLDILLTFSVL